MAEIDLHKLALRFKVVEMIRLLMVQRRMKEAAQYWRRLVRPN
jgi:hypothetical protein